MSKNKYRIINILLVAIIIILIGVLIYNNLVDQKKSFISNTNMDYNPVIVTSNFVEKIDNPYFTLIPGKKFVYESTGEDKERIEIEVTSDIKEILGIKTTVVRDRVYKNSELFEDTFDYYAQDKSGNVWYFGEETKEYESGSVSTKGSWEAGVNGAKPGIIMKSDPKVGDSYRQEYYKGEAEDMADVVAVEKTVITQLKKHHNCLQTRDWSLIDQMANEYKYYCPDAGFLVLEESITGDSKIELVEAN